MGEAFGISLELLERAAFPVPCTNLPGRYTLTLLLLFSLPLSLVWCNVCSPLLSSSTEDPIGPLHPPSHHRRLHGPPTGTLARESVPRFDSACLPLPAPLPGPLHLPGGNSSTVSRPSDSPLPYGGVSETPLRSHSEGPQFLLPAKWPRLAPPTASSAGALPYVAELLPKRDPHKALEGPPCCDQSRHPPVS